MSKSKFNCSQAVFVVVVETILNSMKEFLTFFTARRPKYKMSWITDLRTELAAADALPDEAARQAASSILRVELLALNTQCCSAWQDLADFIRGAFAPSIVDIQLRAAGYERYDKAAGANWSETKAMMKSANTFLTDNLSTLTADENMNEDFSRTFSDLVDAFNAKLTVYETSKEALSMATEAKMNAFNAVYDKMRPMLDDGQKIFRDNEAVRSQFVFANVVDRVSGAGLAGARGIITNELDLMPIQDATVKIWLADSPAVVFTATTDANGKYLINCPSGEYKFKVIAEGYVPSEDRNIKILVGTVSAFDQALVPAKA